MQLFLFVLLCDLLSCHFSKTSWCFELWWHLSWGWVFWILSSILCYCISIYAERGLWEANTSLIIQTFGPVRRWIKLKSVHWSSLWNIALLWHLRFSLWSVNKRATFFSLRLLDVGTPLDWSKKTPPCSFQLVLMLMDFDNSSLRSAETNNGSR